jgi:hypothetical protein
MGQDPAPEWVVSEDDLSGLAELFRQFEGADDPLSVACREAESEFNSLAERIFTEKVKPAFASITISQFRSYARNYCRLRIAKQDRQFPSV